MRTLLSIVILSILLASPAAAAEEPPAELARRFVFALAADDLRAFDPLAAAGKARGAEWKPLRENIEAVDCLDIRSHRIVAFTPSPSGATLDLEIDATAVAAGAPRTPKRFPARWSMDLVRTDRGWAIKSVERSETRRAREIIRAPTDAQRRLVLETDLDPIQLVRELAIAGRGMGAAGKATVDQALSLSRVLGDRAAESHCIGEMSIIVLPEDVASGLRLAEEAFQVALTSSNRDQIGTATLQLGTTHWVAGDIDTGVRYLREAAGMLDTLDDPRDAMAAVYMQSLAESSRSRYREALLALEAFEESLARYEWWEGEVNLPFRQADIQDALGNSSVALAYNRESLRRAEDFGEKRIIAYASSNIAAYARQMGLFPEALAGFERALRLGGDDLNEGERKILHTEIARASSGLGRLDEAELHLTEAQCLAARFPEEVLDTVISFGELRVAQQRPAEALAIIAQAEELGRNSAAFDRWDTLLTVRGRALRRLGRPAEAVAVLREAVEAAETRLSRIVTDAASETNAATERLQPYRELIDVLVEQGELNDALMVANQMSARTLSNVLRQGRMDIAAVMNAEDRERVRGLEADLAERNRVAMLVQGQGAIEERAKAQVAAARLALSGVLTEMNVRYRSPCPPAFPAGGLGHPRALIADESAMVIQYVRTDSSLLLFAITRSGDRLDVAAHRIMVRPADLAARIDRFVSRVATRDAGIVAEARALYDLLLGPVAPLLASHRIVCFIPDESLWRLPMHALRDRSGKYLIERVAVFYSPSLAILGRHVARGSRGQRVLAIGNPSIAQATTRTIEPVYRDVQLQPLPDAAAEALGVVRAYGTAGSHAYVGDEATEDLAKRSAPDYDIVHFATHGVIDNASPMYSALVLGSGGAEDGLLEARELLQMKLKAGLVVLSACETSGGAVRPGEGVIGLAWAVMMAGSRATVVSQWKVVSESTSHLMIDFHRHLAARREEGNAAALRAAQIRMLRDPRYAHPFYWAPFVVIGDGW